MSTRLEGPAEPHVGHVEMVMGTAVTFDVRLADDRPRHRANAVAAVNACVAWLHHVDRTFTTYDRGSVIMRLNRGEVALRDCSAEVRWVVDECERLRAATDGWFNPWGSARGFDPSGLVKGWAAQRASAILSERGFERHCVNAGGDVAVRGTPAGKPSWGVGVAHPLVAGAICAVVQVTDGAVATSGTAERGQHIWRVDGTSARELAAVTILHADLTTADVLATAAFAVGQAAPDWLAARGIDALVIDANGHEWSSAGFERHRSWPPRVNADPA